MPPRDKRLSSDLNDRTLTRDPVVSPGLPIVGLGPQWSVEARPRYVGTHDPGRLFGRLPTNVETWRHVEPGDLVELIAPDGRTVRATVASRALIYGLNSEIGGLIWLDHVDGPCPLVVVRPVIGDEPAFLGVVDYTEAAARLADVLANTPHATGWIDRVGGEPEPAISRLSVGGFGVFLRRPAVVDAFDDVEAARDAAREAARCRVLDAGGGFVAVDDVQGLDAGAERLREEAAGLVAWLRDAASLLTLCGRILGGGRVFPDEAARVLRAGAARRFAGGADVEGVPHERL